MAESRQWRVGRGKGWKWAAKETAWRKGVVACRAWEVLLVLLLPLR